ncbi:MAG: type II CRISPR RNA-guided endonuclease Cas9 [Hyphomicrobiales bacterium]|nr:MAG: type II CRISPR RNA-guided endonuclease Cas9 [Hyphomicrobiales bacterium]
MAAPYRLGLDVGSNSIGWCAVTVDGNGVPSGVLDAGVRILTPNEEAGRDPQSKQSLAANRRVARSSRRRRDRFLRRQKRLMETLIAAGLMPSGEADRKANERLDPYWLRAAALRAPLPLHEIGRAIFHLNQRRGFLSNRIADGDDDEGSAMKAGMKALAEQLEASGAPTLGAFMAERNSRDREGYLVDRLGKRIGKAHGNPKPHPTDTGVRFRSRSEGNKVLYDLYPTRAMVEHELDAIWQAQAPHHDALTNALLKRLKRIIIEQRPLQKPLVGSCTFRPHEERAPRALPFFQRFRILMEVANLEIERPGRRSRKLSIQQRNALVSSLSEKASQVTFAAMRKALKLPADAAFNLEHGKRKGLDPDQTAAVLAKTSKTGKGTSFGKGWRGLSRHRQTEIVENLLTEPDERALTRWLRQECGLTEDAAEAAANARLPQGHAHIGRSMLADLVDVMENISAEAVDPKTGEIYPRPLTYDEAVEHLGLHHSNMEAGRHARLPYYGTAMARHVIANPRAPENSQERIGRVPNPTVHIALNQIRAVVNALIEAYGPPTAIVLELARELKQNKKQKDETTRQNRENEKANEEIRAELAQMGLAYSHGNRLIMRLYRELSPTERICVYTGRPISRTMIEASEVDVDHILPRSRTLDDGFANKVLCTRQANREKGNRAPAEVTEWQGERLREIHERAKRLFPRKAWRFAPDAMEKFEAKDDFLARQLTDSQHIARLAKDYLGHLFGEDRNKRVWATPGRLTAMLRGFWGLNALLSDHNRIGNDSDGGSVKNRDDHRHHALDAFVIACTDRAILQRVATASGRAEELDLNRWAEKGRFPEPFEGYKDALRAALDAMVISHKPDHGLGRGAQGNVHVTSGKLHAETAYGLVDADIDGKHFNLVTRKPIDQLSDREIGQVRDARLREALEQIVYEAGRDGIKPEAALAEYGRRNGIRRVRILKTNETARKVTHGDGFEKAYIPGDNHRIEIFSLVDGEWSGEGVSVFDANKPGYEPDWRRRHPEARLVMRVHNGDLVEADFGEGRRIWRVVRLEPSAKRIRLVRDTDAGNFEKRHKAGDDPFRWNFATFKRLQAADARRVRVDPIGRVSYAEDT